MKIQHNFTDFLLNEDDLMKMMKMMRSMKEDEENENETSRWSEEERN